MVRDTGHGALTDWQVPVLRESRRGVLTYLGGIVLSMSLGIALAVYDNVPPDQRPIVFLVFFAVGPLVFTLGILLSARPMPAVAWSEGIVKPSVLIDRLFRRRPHLITYDRISEAFIQDSEASPFRKRTMFIVYRTKSGGSRMLFLVENRNVDDMNALMKTLAAKEVSVHQATNKRLSTFPRFSLRRRA